MKNLLFNKPEFHYGTNLTVRRGIKWACETEAYLPDLQLTLPITTKLMVFDRLCAYDLVREHAKDCRSYSGLYDAMRAAYPGDFDQREIVTLVYFIVPVDAKHPSLPGQKAFPDEEAEEPKQEKTLAQKIQESMEKTLKKDTAIKKIIDRQRKQKEEEPETLGSPYEWPTFPPTVIPPGMPWSPAPQPQKFPDPIPPTTNPFPYPWKYPEPSRTWCSTQLPKMSAQDVDAALEQLADQFIDICKRAA